MKLTGFTPKVRTNALRVFISLGILLTFSPGFYSIAQAAGGSGTGGGTGGGGGNNPLAFAGAFVGVINGNASTTADPIADSSKMPVDGIIKLIFNLNVVDNAIWAANQTCFKVTDANGNPVSVTVSRIDPAANDNEKTNVFLKPETLFKTSTQYKITISAALAANNGNTLGTDTVVAFGTQAKSDTDDESVSTPTAKKTVAAKSEKPNNSLMTIIAIAAVAVLLMIVLIVVLLRMRKK